MVESDELEVKISSVLISFPGHKLGLTRTY